MPQLNGDKLKDDSDKRNPYRFRGMIQVRGGPVPLQQWEREDKYAEGGSMLGDPLYPMDNENESKDSDD